MNMGTVVALCLMCFFAGVLCGDWKEGMAVSKAVDDLSAMHYQEIQLLVNKIIALRKDREGGAEE